MENNLLEVIEALRPSTPGMIMDMVADAGIDVTSWGITKTGAAVKNPRANPNYTYDWAFGGNGEPTALCIWHVSISIFENNIIFEDNLREFALKLDVIAIDRTKPSDVKSRAASQAWRARRFDSLLQHAFRKSEPIRAILLQGDSRPQAELGWETSKVKYRKLDTESWYVHSYSDNDGSFRLVRGVPLQSIPAINTLTEFVPVFEDQFSIPEFPQKKESSVSGFIRSQEVRLSVLRRAAGICECCGERGFKTTAGAIYLETHHVIPLGENGPDVEWNVVAVCPDDHRRAHFAENRDKLREQLINCLIQTYPDAKDSLLSLLTSNKKIQ